MALFESTTYSSKREKILRLLLTGCSTPDKGYTIKQISNEIGLSIAGVRHYLVMLEKEGLIIKTERQGKAGRPATIYRLSESAQNEFPKAYADFTLELLEEIETRYGKDEVSHFLENLGRKKAQKILREIETALISQGKDINTVPLPIKLEELIKVLEAKYFYPNLIEHENYYTLQNFNCKLYDIITKYPSVCTFHETLVHELTEGKSQKISSNVDGDYCCLFRIEKFID